jgi:hypothetical protein
MTMMAAAWDAIPALVSQLRVDSDPITIVEAFQELGRALRESEIVAASAIVGGAGGIAATISVMKEFPVHVPRQSRLADDSFCILLQISMKIAKEIFTMVKAWND